MCSYNDHIEFMITSFMITSITSYNDHIELAHNNKYLINRRDNNIVNIYPYSIAYDLIFIFVLALS